MKYLRRVRNLFLDRLELAARLEAAETERAELARQVVILGGNRLR